MATSQPPAEDVAGHPLDIVEQIVAAQEWPFDRCSDDELAVCIAGRWCDLQMGFALREDLGLFQFTCAFDLRVPANRRNDVLVLFGLANEKLSLGHFELCSETMSPLLRHALPVQGGSRLTPEQMEDLIEIGMAECERVYPALQFMLWGGKKPDDALAAAMMETVGEA